MWEYDRADEQHDQSFQGGTHGTQLAGECLAGLNYVRAVPW